MSLIGRVPVHLWTWRGIADHFGVGVRAVKEWKRHGAPIKLTDKGAYAEAWALVDWLYEQPDIDTPGLPGNLANHKV